MPRSAEILHDLQLYDSVFQSEYANADNASTTHVQISTDKICSARHSKHTHFQIGTLLNNK